MLLSDKPEADAGTEPGRAFFRCAAEEGTFSGRLHDCGKSLAAPGRIAGDAMGSDALLKIDGVSKRIGGKEILSGVSLELARGDIKVLIGPSGGGKSTLLQCVNLLLFPDQGRIWLNGREVSYQRKREVLAFRQQVGMIFQDFNLFDHLNAVNNVAIALRKVKRLSKREALQRAQAELDRVGLKGKEDLYPAELSGGQKQRVSIARALAMDPVLLLLDEPTSALDPELIGEVLAVIRSLTSKNITMLMATHQVGFARTLAREILFMEQGRIVERGRPSSLLAAADGCRPTRTMDFCSKLSEIYGEEQGE
jgi:polar amino acid transport system ATP-binding protein